MSSEEQKLDAAEYVIGTLSLAERAAFEAVMEADEATREDVAEWQQIFGALNAIADPEQPSRTVWDRIEAELPAEAATLRDDLPTKQAPKTDSPTEKGMIVWDSKAAIAANDRQNQLRRSLTRWRLGAIAAGVAALGFGLSWFTTPVAEPQQQQIAQRDYLALVRAENASDQPALIVKIDGSTGKVTVRSLGVERPANKSLEVWYVPQGQTPVSVGLIDEGDIALGDLKASQGDLVAISLEPEGGSPTGTATGPVIYSGALLEGVD